MKKTIGIVAGGTGGHLIPAESISKKLKDRYEIVLIGHELTKSRYLSDSTIRKIDILAAPLPNSPKSLWKFITATIRGYIKARKELEKLKPSMLLGFGSFHTFPVLLAAIKLKIPLGFFEANRVPGKIVRIFSGFAHWVAIPYPDPLKMIKTVQEEVSFPFRTEFSTSQEDSKKGEGLTILVMGGSQGALFLNETVPLALAPHNERISKVIHLFGKHGNYEAVSKLYQDAGIDADVIEFSNEVAKLMKSADFAICRSGAATIAELDRLDLPALLVPYPFESDGHQTENAKYFCDVKKRGWWLAQKKATVASLSELIGEIILEKLPEMKSAIELNEQKKNPPHLADLIEVTVMRVQEISGGKHRKGVKHGKS